MLKTLIRRVVKTLLWILGGLLGMMLLVMAALQFQAVQRFITQYALSSITEKTRTRIEVGSVSIGFTNAVILHNIFVESRQRDTLLSIQTLSANVDLPALLSHRIELTNIRIDSLTSRIIRTEPDSSFNFDFILDAISQDSTAVVNADAGEAGWTFGVDGARIDGIDLSYDDDVSGMSLGATLGSVEASIDRFDSDSMQFFIRRLSVEGGNSVWYDDRASAKTKGVDPNHLRLDGLRLEAEDIDLGENYVAADVLQASFREQSGFEVRELSFSFLLDSLHARISNFTLETPASRIRQSIVLHYSSFSALMDFPASARVDGHIEESHVGISDLLLFQPSLPIKNVRGASIRFSSEFSGSLRDFQFKRLRVAAGDSMAIDLAGSVRGLPEAKSAFYDLNLHGLSFGRHDLEELVADTLLPKTFIVPASVTMSGNFKGTFRNFSTSSVVTTSIGSISGNAALDSGSEPGSTGSRWNMDLNVDTFDVGVLLNDTETFGPVSLKATAVGMGMSKDNIEAYMDVDVDKAVLNGYAYRRLLFHGAAAPNVFDGHADIQDSSIAFTFDGTVNTSEETPTYKFTLDLKGADLHRLNFTSDDIRVSGNVASDLVGKDVNDINGRIGIRNVVIMHNRRRTVLDSLVFRSVNQEGQTHLSIESEVFTGRFDGTIALGDLPDVLKEHSGRYFTLQATEPGRTLRTQAFTFLLTFREPTPLASLFLPDLQRFPTGTLEGNYDSDKKALNVNIDIPRIDYADFRIDSLTVTASSDADLLEASLKVGSIADSTLRVTNLSLGGKARHDSLAVTLQSTRNDGYRKMFLAGVFRNVPDGYSFRFNDDGVVFDDTLWSVSPDNSLMVGNGRIVARNVLLRGGGQSLLLQSTAETGPRPPLRAEFTDFDITTVSQLVVERDGSLGGILDGNVVVEFPENQMAFTSDLTIKDFTFGKKLIGDVVLRANNQTQNIYEVSLDIAGNGNQVALQGNYRNEKDGNKLNLRAEFTKVNLATLEPLTFGSVQRLSGTMSGALQMTGTMKKPSFTGNLNFTNAAFSPVFLNTYLRLNSGTIEMDAQGISLKTFNLVDTFGNTASVRGHFFTEDFRRYQYDVRIHTDNFLVFNRPPSRDAIYHGIVILDSDISVQGDQNRQKITIQAELNKGTDLAISLPESELAVEERRGIVRFVEVRTPAHSIMSRRNVRTRRDTTEGQLSQIDLTSNITVNKDSKLRILIDPIAGDSLVIQGEATVSFIIDPSGKLTLTGRYEIVDGSYHLSFADLIRREFAISKGSSLTWFGSPYEAEVDITAMYTVKTTVLDLVQDQVTEISEEERNKYKQEIPIQVYLMMKGNLLTPGIHFRLDLPPDERGVLDGTVYAKLNELNGQESELNKQVFALLVLGRFISANPLAAYDQSDGLSDFVRSSASQILSAQLNRLSERYITGVSLDVGLESYQDYSTGNAEGRTQMKLALSKQLFNERVTVQVGGNVDIEGQRSRENTLDNFAGDLKVLYKLTEDGRWQLQVFRQNSYAGAIDGDITKTGVGIMFTIDYNKLFGITLKPVREEGQ